MSATQAARALVQVQPRHPVVSFYLDLDPERFASPPTRSSQIQSLLDRAHREVQQRDLPHDDRQALRDDLARIESFLGGSDAPFQGARALAIFCSLRDELFEVVPLARPQEGMVLIAPTAHVEPLVRGPHDRTWCVALVSRCSARILSGLAAGLVERQRIEDNVHGQHDPGGWSQSPSARSVDHEADDHLRRVARMLHRRWRREPFDRLALGGPTEAVARLEDMLHPELRPLLAERRVEVDVAAATEDSVRGAMARLAEDDERAHERSALARLADGLGREARTSTGLAATLTALGERRVATLLLATSFPRAEAVVEAALAQDAEIVFVRHAPDLEPHGGIAALLRYSVRPLPFRE